MYMYMFVCIQVSKRKDFFYLRTQGKSIIRHTIRINKVSVE